jgi:hypothetical protein
VLKAAYVGQHINPASGRVGKHYRCAICQNIFPTSQVQVDHIDPVIPVTGFTSWDDVVERMFSEKEGYQVLCLPCHKVKSKKENEERRKNAKQ